MMMRMYSIIIRVVYMENAVVDFGPQASDQHVQLGVKRREKK